jgi:NAD(P)H-flavin reductase
MTFHSAETMYTPIPATIEHIEHLTPHEKLFTISLDNGKPLGHKAGQFVTISVFGIGEAPISVTSSPSRSNGTFELGIRKVGDVTGAIHNLERGAKIGIRGPFGTSFPVDEMKGKDVLIVAGGCGLFPARSVINEVVDRRAEYHRVIILYGTRSPADRLFVEELADWHARKEIEFLETVDNAVSVESAGETCWAGNVGVITTLFPHVELDPAMTYPNIVGPPIMYKFVLKELAKKNIPDEQVFMSLERRMKCGVGKCGHCQINGLYSCQSGPVFRYSDIRNLKEAL